MKRGNIVGDTNCIFLSQKKVNHNSNDDGKNDEDNEDGDDNDDAKDNKDNGYIKGGNVG